MSEPEISDRLAPAVAGVLHQRLSEQLAAKASKGRVRIPTI
jgi:hypothetical protein